MGTKIIPYFSFNPLHGFLSAGTDAAVLAEIALSRCSFYIHIASSWFAMSRWCLAAHSASCCTAVGLCCAVGWGWSMCCLFWHWLALRGIGASGRLCQWRPGRTGQASRFQCIVWWLFTLQAWRYARRKQWEKHANAMLRSLAVTTAAMSLRTESYILFYLPGYQTHQKPT